MTRFSSKATLTNNTDYSCQKSVDNYGVHIMTLVIYSPGVDTIIITMHLYVAHICLGGSVYLVLLIFVTVEDKVSYCSERHLLMFLVAP